MKIDGIEINPKVTADVVADAVERQRTTLDSPGFCIACGLENDGCEPDARKYICESCGQPTVYGADELLIMMF